MINLVINGLPGAIFEMLVTENNKKPKLWFSIAQLLFTIDLQYLTLNVCLCKWCILIHKLLQKEYSSGEISKSKMAANHGR